MFMVNFSQTALNFGYDFALSTFLGTPCNSFLFRGSSDERETQATEV